MRILIDMDEVLADFYNHPNPLLNIKAKRPIEYTNIGPPEMYVTTFFKDLLPLDGAIKSVRILIAWGFDIYICTKPVAGSPVCYSEKAEWIAKYLPDLSHKIIMVQDKGMVIADYLIDDSDYQLESFKGKTIKFNPKNSKAQWESITTYFSKQKGK